MVDEQIEAGTITNERIALAMGWVWLENRRHPGQMILCEPDTEWVEVFEAAVQTGAEDVFHFTTDPAQVVPMIKRIGELVGCSAYLAYYPAAERWACWLHGEAYGGDTANLAVAAVLLAAWERRKGDVDHG